MVLEPFFRNNLIRNRFVLLALVLLILLPPIVTAEQRRRIVIEKAARKISVYEKDILIASFKIALGRNPVGAKRCQGDSKTPEGHYTISGRNPGSAFHRSLRVSYPNSDDKKKAAALGCPPGGDIMIHGLPNGQGYVGAAHTAIDWTDGCIAVTDREIETLWREVPDGTPVEIKP